MAQNPSIQTNYGGEFLNRLLTLVTTGNELFERGLIHMEQNVSDKYSIPRMQLSKILQKRVEQPTEANSKGQFTIDERVLQPQDVMAYTEFNPRSFEKFWKPFQPTGELVFGELPSNVQEQSCSKSPRSPRTNWATISSTACRATARTSSSTAF